MHVLVPGAWPVKQGHALCEHLENEIGAELANATVLTHLEALEDPASFEDQELDRVDFACLRQRLRQNSVQEKVAVLWVDRALRKLGARA